MKNNFRPIQPLLWVMLFDHASLNISFPVLTLLFFDLHTRLFAPDTSDAVRSMWYGLCVAVPHVVNIITAPLLSALSDEFGRKKILLVGTFGAFLFAITSAFGVVIGSLSLVFLGRFIQGAFSRTNPIAQAVIGDVCDRQNKMIAMGYLQTSISLGAFIGPVIGGYFANQFLFEKFNFSLPFFVSAIAAGISCFLTVFLFKETLVVKRSHAPWSEFNFQIIKKVFSNRDVLSISAVLLLSQISWSMYYQYMPPILKTQFQFDAHQLGWFVGLIALWLALATTFGIKMLDSFLSFRQILMVSIYLILIGLLMTIAAFLAQPGSMSTFFVWFSAVPTAVGDVIAFSCLTTLYSNAVEIHQQGKVMAVCFIVVALIWALTGMVGGALMSVYGLLPLLIAPVGIVGAIGLLHCKVGQRLGV